MFDHRFYDDTMCLYVKFIEFSSKLWFLIRNKIQKNLYVSSHRIRDVCSLS